MARNQTIVQDSLGNASVSNNFTAANLIRSGGTASQFLKADGSVDSNAYVTVTTARSALSFVAGSGAYNSSTGVITIPTNTNQLTNGAGFITGYTETDTLASVTGRGATTSTFSAFNGGLTSTKTSKNTYAIQIKGGFYGAPRLQLYDLAVDGNAYVGLGVDMSGAAYEFSNYFPRIGGNGRWSVGSWAGDFGTGQYVSGYNEKLWLTESAAAFNVPLTVNGRITSTSSLGLYVNSGGASYIGINSTSSWAYTSLLNNGTTTWDLGAFNGGNFEFRPYGGDANKIIVGLNGVLYFTDTTNGFYKSGGRLTARSESTDNVANFASYGLYLPKTGETAGLYVESPIEARGGLRIGSGAGSGTINVGADTGVVGSRLVQRDGNGYIYANHINFNTSESENPVINSFFTSNGDGWSRKSSIQHVRNQLGNYGGWITASALSSYLPLSGGTITSRTYLHQAGGGGGQNLFTGVDAPSSANGRGQFILSSAYSDLVIASSQSNGNHGSTLTFATYNPSNAGDYRKFVINQGNWGGRAGFLDFGFADAARTNPHEYINTTDDVMSLDGYNKRVGINIMSPSYTLDVAGLVNTASGYISVGNPWGTSNSAFFPNGITTAGGTNWVYGLTYLGNAPGNGSGVEVAGNGRIYVRANSAAASHGFSGLFVDRNSASSNYIPWSFENEYGNHSWGIVARFRISQSGADRPSIQFSSASSDTRWNLGYNTGSDDHFRITQNMGYRNDNSTSDGWGTERFRINTDGTTYLGIQGQIVYFNGAESANLYGIRGRFTNEFIHLYQKVGVGHPGGWGQGEGNTPTQGLSTYGGITVAYGTGGTSTFHGHLRVTGNNNLYLDSNFGQSIVGLYSASRYQGIFAMGDAYKLPVDGTSPGNLYGLAWSHPNTGGVAGNLNTHGLLVLENGTFLAAISGSIRARDDMRAPIFYDSNDTGYYLDPNGTSNLQTWTADTAARLGRSRYWTNRWAIYGGINDYMTGTNGWGMDHGGWNQAWKGGFSGWDIWGTGTGHPQGGGYIHAQGIISGQHAASSDGSSAYGWMMVGAHNATENRYWLRGKWATSTSGWVEMITTGNIGSQSVNYANSAGSLSNMNISQFSNNSGYITSGSNVVGLYSSGWGNGNFTWYQTPGGLAPYGGGWASFLVSNHGDGSNYYNQTIIMPFWGVPQYSRREGGTNVGPWTFWTTENLNPNSISGNLSVSGNITAGGDVTAYSDARVKENVETIVQALDKVLQLRGVSYNRTDSDDKKTKIGVIAQETLVVVPEVVNQDNSGMYNVSYGNLAGLFIEAIKEQQKQIEELQNKLDNVLSSR